MPKSETTASATSNQPYQPGANKPGKPHIMTGLQPPQVPPKWSHSPEEVTALTKAAIAKTKAVLDQVGSLVDEDCNFQSVSSTSTAG
jgi:hypothetical protein